MLFVQGNLIPSYIKYQLNTDSRAVVGVMDIVLLYFWSLGEFPNIYHGLHILASLNSVHAGHFLWNKTTPSV